VNTNIEGEKLWVEHLLERTSREYPDRFVYGYFLAFYTTDSFITRYPEVLVRMGMEFRHVSVLYGDGTLPSDDIVIERESLSSSDRPLYAVLYKVGGFKGWGLTRKLRPTTDILLETVVDGSVRRRTNDNLRSVFG